jgi:hypothetical protein
MFGRAIVVMWFAVGLVHVGSAVAQDGARFSAEISKLTPQLESVISGGHWKRGDEEGGFRLIVRMVGFERIRNEAYLQWIREGSDPDQRNIIERTIEIPEIAGWRITAQRFALDTKQWKIVVSAERENLVEDMPKTQKRFFTIIPAGDYSYRVVESD